MIMMMIVVVCSWSCRFEFVAWSFLDISSSALILVRMHMAAHSMPHNRSIDRYAWWCIHLVNVCLRVFVWTQETPDGPRKLGHRKIDKVTGEVAYKVSCVCVRL